MTGNLRSSLHKIREWLARQLAANGEGSSASAALIAACAVIFGIILLAAARRRSELLILLVVPFYYLAAQSFFHTEYRYILAIHYFLFVVAAVTLYVAGNALWQIARLARARYSRQGS